MSDSEASTVHARLHAHAPAEVSVARATERLRDAGQRITTPRRSVLRALAQHHEHLRADEVADLLAADGVHRATVYRTLELLADKGVVSCRALPGGATGYHLDVLADEQEHLHAHCQSCSRVVAVPVHALDAAVEIVQRAVGFRLAPQRSDLTGLCSRCDQPPVRSPGPEHGARDPADAARPPGAAQRHRPGTPSPVGGNPSLGAVRTAGRDAPGRGRS